MIIYVLCVRLNGETWDEQKEKKNRFVILVDLIMKMKVIKWIYKKKAGKISSIYHKIHSMKSSYVYEMTFDDRFCKQE